MLNIGDVVLVKKVGFQGPHKLENRWENEHFVVKVKPNADIPVYTVVPQHGKRDHAHYIAICCCHWESPQQRMVKLGQCIQKERSFLVIVMRMIQGMNLIGSSPIAV